MHFGTVKANEILRHEEMEIKLAIKENDASSRMVVIFSNSRVERIETSLININVNLSSVPNALDNY